MAKAKERPIGPSFNVPNTKAKLDAEAFDLTKIRNRQEQYLSKHGHYWQGLPTIDDKLLPENGNSISLDIDKKPNDVKDNWNSLRIFSTSDKTRFSVIVDQYEGFNGHGYVIKFRFKHAGNVYQKAINHGPETYRQHDWKLIQEPN